MANTADDEARSVLSQTHSRITEDDNDSALGDGDDSVMSDTESIRSSMLAYRMEHGRRYSERAAEYWGPNDDRAQDMMDMTHTLWKRTLEGSLYLSPLEYPQRALDIGTGTGIWAIEFADQHPACEVIGTDVSVMQPVWVPPNLRFEVDDADKDWTWTENHFDYIHIRGLYGGISDWPAFYQRCMRILKPGGYLEHTEFLCRFESQNNSIVPGDPLDTCNKDALGGYAKLNRPQGELNIGDTMRQRLEDAGYIIIRDQPNKWPVGPWARNKELKHIGRWVHCIWDSGLEDFATMICRGLLGMSEEELVIWCMGIRQQLSDKKNQVVWPYRIVVAQKPEFGHT